MVCSNKIYNRVMLGGKDNENGDKTTICLISKKATFTRAVNFFVYFIAVDLHDYNMKLPETSWLHVLCRKRRTCSCFPFFWLSLIFTLVAASISLFLTTATKFHVVPPTKVSFVFLSLALAVLLVELRWPVLYFLFFSVSLSFSIFQICGHDN